MVHIDVCISLSVLRNGIFCIRCFRERNGAMRNRIARANLLFDLLIFFGPILNVCLKTNNCSKSLLNNASRSLPNHF